MQKYTAEYFISKFERIPSKRFTSGGDYVSHGRMCALGHCGQRTHRDTEEGKALQRLFNKHGLIVTNVNDGKRKGDTVPYTIPMGDTTAVYVTDLGKGAKERILNALTLIATGLLKKTK